MMWDLPTETKVEEQVYHITNRCDYRVVLDVIVALNDEELTDEQKVLCGLMLFYEELNRDNVMFCPHLEYLQKEMYRIINGGEEQEENQEPKPQLMDWERDFPILSPQINKVLKAEIRNPNEYFHWFTVIGGYYGIDPENNIWANVVGIRSKLAKGKKLEHWEQEFYREHRRMVELPRKLTAEEEEFLNSDW